MSYTPWAAPIPFGASKQSYSWPQKMCGQPRRLLISCIKCIFYDCNTKCSTNMTKYGMLDDRPLQSYDGGKTVKTIDALTDGACNCKTTKSIPWDLNRTGPSGPERIDKDSSHTFLSETVRHMLHPIGLGHSAHWSTSFASLIFSYSTAEMSKAPAGVRGLLLSAAHLLELRSY